MFWTRQQQIGTVDTLRLCGLVKSSTEYMVVNILAAYIEGSARLPATPAEYLRVHLARKSRVRRMRSGTRTAPRTRIAV